MMIHHHLSQHLKVRDTFQFTQMNHQEKHRWLIQSSACFFPHLFSCLQSKKPASSALPPAGKRNTAFLLCFFLNLCSSALACILQGAERWREGSLGGALLWRGRGLGRGAGGGGSRALQGAQSLAEPRVLGCLDLVHQDSPLVLELLQSDKRSTEVSATGAARRRAFSLVRLKQRFQTYQTYQTMYHQTKFPNTINGKYQQKQSKSHLVSKSNS